LEEKEMTDRDLTTEEFNDLVFILGQIKVAVDTTSIFNKMNSIDEILLYLQHRYGENASFILTDMIGRLR
jgi:hypothetical protein